ncbi:Uncharacterised protein [Vibrio cholerae]|nr:Uncharacterised protein [Vibrio cholerae]
MLFELAFHVGQHAARNLSHQNARIAAFHHAFKGVVFFAYITEVSRNLFEFGDIQSGVVAGALQGSDQ